MVTLTREEAQQVLDALSQAVGGHNYTVWAAHGTSAIETLRARLAQPEPEPHGYLWFTRYMEQRFTHRKPEELERIGEVTPVFAAPPQREWQGLADETYWEMWVEWPSDVLRFAHAIEAKLKEKNI